MAQNSPHKTIPDHTAVRVALWRALHLEVDAVPYVLKDNVGAQIVGEEGWRNRPDMDPQRFIGPRASIVGRARLIEDVLEELVQRGVGQYVILGAGLDTFGQRRSDLGAHLNVFEIDQPETQKWKKNRLSELGFKIPEWLKFVPVDFEAGESWIEQVEKAGFDKNKPAFVVSTGVSMYLTKEANLATLKQMASLAPASVFAMTFMLPLELLEPQDRPLLEFTIKRTQEAGTPFISFYAPNEMIELAKASGFKNAKHISNEDLNKKYFSNRSDNLKIPGGEAFLIAEV